MRKLIIVLSLLLSVTPLFGFEARTTSYASQEDGCYHAANGQRLKEGMCAADWRYWAPGTTFLIQGKVYTVTDKGSDVIGPKHIDIFTPSLKAMRRRGTIYCDVKVLTSGANKNISQNTFTYPKNTLYYSSKHNQISVKPKEELVCINF